MARMQSQALINVIFRKMLLWKITEIGAAGSLHLIKVIFRKVILWKIMDDTADGKPGPN